MSELQKPVIGITCGDLNGIGTELIIKSLHDNRILDVCVPVVFASSKSINFYRKSLADINFVFNTTKDLTRLNPKQVNVFNCWEEEVAITPGQLNEIGGKYARISLQFAIDGLKSGHLQGLVTAPINKKNIQSPEFNYTGHTPYLRDQLGVKDVVMILAADNMRVAVVTEHVPVKDITQFLSKEIILSKLQVLNFSLQKDFGIDKPKIAVLALNPHAGDEGLIGNEEETIIKPAIKEAKYKNVLAFGPFSADAFFARGQHEKFDAVLAMYHDQGLIPFKSLSVGEGINYTAGLPIVRTSPDHGTAFDIAGKGKADPSSFIDAIFKAVDIARQRSFYEDNHRNPLRKMSAMVVANAEDERIEEQ
ncbi:MAG: 4-hydroxythreonine-4-phosphate dehydrogenase [Chitinophagaceae bacterium]|nr:4-hydroxythreonine-4-phosphate dehydrogenase [Chitinophagaceae bacterium]